VRGYIQYLSFDIPLFFRLLFCRADIVIAEPPPTTGLVTAIASWLRRRPYVYYAADVWTDGLIAMRAPRVMIRLMKAIEGQVLRHAARVLAVSDEVANKVREFRVHDDRVVVVGNGVDTETFRPDGAAIATDGPMFVYTGIMSEWQDPSVFVQAMPLVLEQYPNACLQFFGHGSEEVHLKSITSDLGLDCVRFGGVVPPATIAAWLRGATAALASIKPGLGYDFAKPTKIYAAAASGAPVIFAGAGAGAALVEANALGWRCEHTAVSVADAMLAAIAAQAAGTSEVLLSSRVEWVAQNASIAAAGSRAASEVLAVLDNCLSSR
jgi:glycosyltransferase involved in cell wall biosynthesis